MIRAGVVLTNPIGKNNGVVKGHKYFMCRPKHGILVDPAKVKVETMLHRSWTATVQDAVMKVVSTKVPAQKAAFVAKNKVIDIRSSDSKESWYLCKANDIAYFAKFGDGKAIVFVALDNLDGHLYCRILMGSEKTISTVFDTISENRKKARTDGDFFPNFRAIQNNDGDGVMYDYLASNQSTYYASGPGAESLSKQNRRAKLFSSAVSSDETPNDSVGVFEAVYLGTETLKEVGKKRSQKKQTTEKAVKVILSNKEKQVVFIKVGIEGIKVRTALTEETLTAFVIDDIRFTTVIPDVLKNTDIFAILQKDANLGVFHCHAYQCGNQRAKPIADAISAAFMHFQVRSSSDPFQATGKRLASPSSLFKRQVHRSDLKAKNAIGAGQFGQVYSAMQTIEEKVSMKRAVKMLRGAASEADRMEFIREAEVMLELDHPNLVSLIGVCVQQAPWLIVLEFLDNGDLRTILKACVTKGVKLAYFEQLKWMVDISAGMSFLEKKNLIHMDLAARNCLLGVDNTLKVADFGLTVQLDPGEDNYIVSTDMRIPIKWCSPEALTNRSFSVKSDVWAAGVTFWEIFSYGNMPYPDVPVNQMARKLREGTRLVLPRKLPTNVINLVQSCWSMGTLDRPTFAELRSELYTYFKTAPKTSAPRDIGATLHAKEDPIDLQEVQTNMPSGYEYGDSQSMGTGYEYGAAQDAGVGAVAPAEEYDYEVRTLTSLCCMCHVGVSADMSACLLKFSYYRVCSSMMRRIRMSDLSKFTESFSL